MPAISHQPTLDLGLDPVDEISRPSEQPDVFRPMQYLGSKLRALIPILESVRAAEPHPRTVLDLFSGTSAGAAGH